MEQISKEQYWQNGEPQLCASESNKICTCGRSGVCNNYKRD